MPWVPPPSPGTDPGPLPLREDSAPWAQHPCLHPAPLHPSLHPLPCPNRQQQQHEAPAASPGRSWLCLHVLGSPEVPVPQPWKVPQQRLLPPPGALGGTGVPISAPCPRELQPVPGMVPVPIFTLCLLGSSALLLSATPGAQGKAALLLRGLPPTAFLLFIAAPLLADPRPSPCGGKWEPCTAPRWISASPQSLRAAALMAETLGGHQSHSWHPQPRLGTSPSPPAQPCAPGSTDPWGAAGSLLNCPVSVFLVGLGP